MPFSRILIAIDGSDLSFDAAKFGFDLAAEVGAQAATLFVVDPAVAYSGEIGIPKGELEYMISRENESVLEGLRRSVRIPEATSHFVEAGHPQDVIVRLARDWSADMIVVGSHGRTGVGRALLGSVAEAVVRHAPCPVLVVRSSDA